MQTNRLAAFPHLRCMIKRHTTPGALAIYFLFAATLLPRLIDYALDEPWIGNKLSVLLSTESQLIVMDTITTRRMVQGDRTTSIEMAEDGTVICQRTTAGVWEGPEINRNWKLTAFAGACDLPEGEKVKICSRFAVYSRSGRHRGYGPYCTPETVIPNQIARRAVQ